MCGHSVMSVAMFPVVGMVCEVGVCSVVLHHSLASSLGVSVLLLFLCLAVFPCTVLLWEKLLCRQLFLPVGLLSFF